MWNIRSILQWGLLGCLMLISCGKDHGNPVSPSGETFTVRGKTLNSLTFPPQKTVIRITGKGVEKTVTPEANGEFSIPELPAGKYVVHAERNGYILYPDSLEVTLPGDEKNTLNFIIFSSAEYDYLMQSKDCRIYGRIVTEDGTPVLNVSVNRTATYDGGEYFTNVSPGDTLLLVPEKKGYSYSFTPDSLVVVADRKILFADFTAHNEGAPLHSISGRFILKDYRYPIRIWLMENGWNVFSTGMDSTGSYIFPDIKDGSYTLRFDTGKYRYERNNIPIVLNGADIALPDIVGTYTGPTNHLVFGKVVNPEGIGIPGVVVEYYSDIPYEEKYKLETDANGEFIADRVHAFSGKSVRIIFRPFLDPYAFSPDSAFVTVTGEEGKYLGDTIVLPDFVGRDYSHMMVTDYYPLRTGASWTYERTQTGEAIQEYTVSISGKTMIGGVEYFHTSVPGPAGLADSRIGGNSVRTSYRSEDAELFRFGVAPGASWKIGVTSGSYPVTGKFLGLEAVTVPAGTWPDCAKFEVRTTYGETSYSRYLLWFAKGVGMVRSEYTLVNYGQPKESVTLELREYGF